MEFKDLRLPKLNKLQLVIIKIKCKKMFNSTFKIRILFKKILKKKIKK